MSSSLRRAVATFCTILIFAMSPSFARAAGTEKTSSGPRRQISTIIFAGLGGAILGLSTLSFYSRPQDKLGNIALGFALGVILGTGFVTYQAATTPSSVYGGYDFSTDPTLPRAAGSDEVAREMIAESVKKTRAVTFVEQKLPMMSWSWSF